MDAKRFEEIAEARIAHCRKTLLAKGEEYSRDGDRLHNFKTAATMDRETPEQATPLDAVVQLNSGLPTTPPIDRFPETVAPGVSDAYKQGVAVAPLAICDAVESTPSIWYVVSLVVGTIVVVLLTPLTVIGVP